MKKLILYLLLALAFILFPIVPHLTPTLADHSTQSNKNTLPTPPPQHPSCYAFECIRRSIGKWLNQLVIGGPHEFQRSMGSFTSNLLWEILPSVYGAIGTDGSGCGSSSSAASSLNCSLSHSMNELIIIATITPFVTNGNRVKSVTVGSVNAIGLLETYTGTTSHNETDLWYMYDTNAGPETVTVTWNASGSVAFIAVPYSGTVTSKPFLDLNTVSNAATGTGTAAVSVTVNAGVSGRRIVQVVGCSTTSTSTGTITITPGGSQVKDIEKDQAGSSSKSVSIQVNHLDASAQTTMTATGALTSTSIVCESIGIGLYPSGGAPSSTFAIELTYELIHVSETSTTATQDANWRAADYDGATYTFDVVYTSTTTGTIFLRNVNTAIDDASLAAGNVGSTATRVESTPFAPSTNGATNQHTYGCRTSSSSITILSCRIKIGQVGTITAYEFELKAQGAAATRAANTYAALANTLRVFFQWDKSSRNGTVQAFFEAALSTNYSSNAAYACLAQINTTTCIGTTEVSTIATSKNTARSADNSANLADGTKYEVIIKNASTSTTTLYDARLVITQTGSVSKLEFNRAVGSGQAGTTNGTVVDVGDRNRISSITLGGNGSMTYETTVNDVTDVTNETCLIDGGTNESGTTGSCITNSQIDNGTTTGVWSSRSNSISITQGNRFISNIVSGSSANNLNMSWILVNIALTASITITSSPVTGSGYITVDSVAETTPYVVTWNVGDSHTITANSPVGCGTGCQYEWKNWSDGGAQSHSITVSSLTSTYTANYQKEWSITFSYSVSGGGSPTAPNLGYTRDGVTQSPVALTNTPVAYWVDDATTWSATPTPLAGSGASEQWDTNQATSASASASTTIALAYYNQYLQTLSYSVTGGGTPTAPTYTATQFAASTPQVLTTSATGYWYDSGSSWSVTNPLGGSTGSEQWSTTQSTSGTLSSANTIMFTYNNQYMLTMSASLSSGGSVSPSTGWQNSGTVIASISATPNGGYSFNGWTGTGTISYTGSSNPCTNCVTMNSAISETGNFLAVVVTVNNRTLSVSSGGANMTAPQAVSPTVEYWFGTGISDTASTSDINSVTVDLYRTGHTPGTFANSFVYSFRWVANGWSGTPACSTSPGCWQELQSSGWVASSFNYLVSADSSVTTISGSVLNAKWQFAVKLDQLAVYTTSGAGLWNFKVTGVSKATGNPSNTRAGTFDVNLLISITVTGNMNWGAVAAGSVNVTASGMPVYTTYTANAIVNITVYGSGNPVNQYGDSFPLSYTYVGKTSNPASNDGVVLSTSSTVLYSSLPVAANSNLPTYWFISTPNPFTPGSYTFTYYETIQLQSMQT